MRLIDVTNSYAHLVSQQLANTNAQLVQVYSLGQTTVVFTESPHHQEVLFTNERRNIQNSEIDFALRELTGKTIKEVKVLRSRHLAEVTFRTTEDAAASV
ncbi:DUF1827 family protein [Lacticaseibacillus sharpeae]|uniref:DUF1827 family protein n=1 Tax=Lacticaseibacillus sharpeae JCM 1186 = DSM 20505 TaxID=1291052 RepID=A0A0R1ZN83_9LACO|nr:DUF1827 family protein [Lacticaseibacillus sharpeae]KRM56560.1 hypothetical protein FC18_GL002041 [Lacticaseibacillus sharpeae JCM 1186 = DSM 20505]